MLQYVYLEVASAYGLKEILLHGAIVLNENLAGINTGGDKGQGLALEFKVFEVSPPHSSFCSFPESRFCGLKYFTVLFQELVFTVLFQ